MTRPHLLAAGLLAAAFIAIACTDSSGGGTPGAGGGGAGTTGAAGAGGTAAGGAGGTSAGGAAGSSPDFMSVPPCAAEANYMTGATVNFPASASDFSYSPKCLKVPAGTMVTFSGDFSFHPLEPSTHRGTLTGNPITSTATGSTKSFNFTTPGFYAYFCSTHGPSDGAAGMVGVIWVE
jgi:plastocyanin